jgi:anti-sigma regulatory factor (Ser/Thr protein kinase)
MKLTLHATPEEVMRAVESLQELGESWQLAPKEIFGLSLALEECGSNIVNHSLQRDRAQTFEISINHTSDTVILELRDCGPAFDPTQAPVVPLEADDDLPPGGWGIQLVRRYIDDIQYAREGSENVLRLTKRLIRE